MHSRPVAGVAREPSVPRRVRVTGGRIHLKVTNVVTFPITHSLASAGHGKRQMQKGDS